MKMGMVLDKELGMRSNPKEDPNIGFVMIIGIK